MKRIVCLWLPNWPLQRLIVAEPGLESRSVVLYQPGHGGDGRVVTCSSTACQLGVRPGMPLVEARALAHAGTSHPVRRTGPSSHGARWEPTELYCEPYDLQADREALERLAVECERFSPLVGLEAVESPESLLLDITGLAPLLGSESTLVQRAVEALQHRGYRLQAVVADTIGAAWAVAHFGWVECGAKKFQIVSPGKSRDVLQPLPIEALRLPTETIDLLRKLGILQIGQLAKLPRDQLASRFQPCLLKRLDQATGRADEVLIAQRIQPEMAAEWSFESPTDRYRLVDRVMDLLMERVVGMLIERGCGALRLLCQFDCLSSTPVTFTVGLFQPSASAGHLLELVRMRLERTRLTGPVNMLRLTVTARAPLVDRQQRLFDDEGPERDSHELATLLDRLTGRLGRRAVTGVRMVPDAQPELAYRDQLLTDSPRRRRPMGTSADPMGPLQRPLFLLSCPVPLEVVAVVPDGPPIRFRWTGGQHHVARHWGPERIETGWWRKQPVRRDYYRVETTIGHRFWLFRRLADDRWFLHGEFG